MSIESILKANKDKNPRKRHSGIVAHDAKYTGDEPVWDGWQSWSVDAFMKERSRALNFYNYYSNAGDLKPHVLEWMEANGYSKEDIKAVKRAPDYHPGITAGSLCKAMNRGMPAMHPLAQQYHDSMPGVGGTARSDEEFVRERIALAVREGQKEEESDKAQTGRATQSISPMERLAIKTRSTIIMELDLLLEKWMDSGNAVEVLPIFERMKAHGLSAPSAAQVEKWLTKQRDEMLEAYNKTCDQMVEGYSYLTAKQLKARIDACDTMLADLDKFRHSAKAQRAPRTPKPVSATKQTLRLKYLKDCPEYKITSINPVRIVGAHRLLVFNAKYRTLFDFVCDKASGFAIKGSTLKNVDDLKTRCIRLRKPEDFLTVVQNNTAKQIDKAWSNLTTKESKPKHRINKEMVLLRVFEQPV